MSNMTELTTERFFNTSGPMNPEWHYCVPPLSRLNMDELQTLLYQRKYFVLHAPRQTGKTTCLKALVNYLNAQGRFRACYMNVEVGQGAREDAEKAFLAINGEMVSRAKDVGEPRIESLFEELTKKRGSISAFSELLEHWAKLDSRPLVLIIDEVDSLIGDTLITFLRSLRARYDRRPQDFPSSVILCGVRDVRDYRLASSDKSIVTGGSAFNIKDESLRLGDFSRQEVERLLGQHTESSKQIFTPEAIEAIWQLTLGQPWLINALAYQSCFRDSRGRDRSRPIDLARVEDAKEALILRRDTHLDQLSDKLREERVRRVIQPVILGEEDTRDFFHPDDLQYCIDLGFVRRSSEGLIISNPIYREVIPRDLTADAQEFLVARFKPDWIKPDGALDVYKLMAKFQDFYCENGEAWASRFAYQEAGPQLLLQAFMQRVINGQGRIEREYALGTGRTDLYLKWPHASGIQKVVFELKVLHKGIERTIADGIAQVAAYAERCGVVEAHLLIFARKANISSEQRIFQRQECYQGRTIQIWGM